MQTLKEFCQANNVTVISHVRENVNQLKYCTFMINGVAENIYFSKGATKKVNLGDTAKAIRDMFIVEATNANGESRLKIASGSEFTSVDSLWL